MLQNNFIRMRNVLIALWFCMMGCCAYADDTGAVFFAKQSGTIAGFAEACGQPVSTMVMRSGEVIEALALDATDKTYATAAFEKSRQEASASQTQSQQIACPKVISDFNSLPLLQPDYEKTVIAPLVASNPKKINTTTGMPTTPPAPVAAQTPPVAPPGPTWTQPPPTQQYVNPSMANPAAVNPATPPANSANGQSNQQNPEMARLQLAQQLASMAQTLVNNSAVIMPTPVNSPEMNTQLYGVGANNPIFTGMPLPQPNLAPPPQTGK